MKTGSNIKLIYDSNNDCHLDAFAAIADEWNADVKATAANYTHSQQALQKARKQLRKLRQELAEAKGLAGVYFHQRGMHEETISRLENLIERIAKGNQMREQNHEIMLLDRDSNSWSRALCKWCGNPITVGERNWMKDISGKLQDGWTMLQCLACGRHASRPDDEVLLDEDYDRNEDAQVQGEELEVRK